MPGVSGKQPDSWLALEGAPVIAQPIEQPGAEHYIAIPVALAAVNVNHHATAVDIFNLKMGCFRPPCARTVESHQHRAVKGAVGRIDKAPDLFRTEDLRQPDDLPRIWGLGNTPVLLQHLDIEEAKSSKTLNDRVGL